MSRLSTEDERLTNFLRSNGYRSWRDRVESVGGCARPVRLVGSTRMETGSTGTVVDGFEGTMLVPCGNRREAVCEPCSARYASDTFHLVRAGLTGGKGVPETVTEQVRVFATLTAPSFGPVHNQPRTRSGKARRCACGEFHHDADTRLGTALDPASYDYVGAVLWQAHSTELWRRFTITVARQLAAVLGIPAGELREHVRVSYAKVAEYQRRGLVHFHAVIRVDGPGGPGTPAPVAVTADLLCAVVRSAAASVTVTTKDTPELGARTLGWGDQVDAEPIAAHTPDDPQAVLHDRRVAGYIAKYATKGTGATSGVDSRIKREEAIADLDVSEHHRIMIATAWWLGGLVEFEALNLRRWAHMLGFRGHFLTKSRYYSTTFTSLRAARAAHRLAEHLDRLGITDTDDVVIVNDWAMTGVGYRTDAQRELAHAIATRKLARRIGADGGAA
ncbi:MULTISPECIES: replication initiator [unclassified Saccharothrix]|uniref:replication initiator n=1 Tax=unclassified Saccharothrix TaxID=2593673 RepID=UPI00307D3774